MHVHLVRPGDTLANLARRYRVTPGQLSLCNDLPSSAFLLPGQALCIPSQFELSGTEGYTTYLVQAGDTPRAIAEAWRIPLTWLAFCNELHDHTLQPGELLLLPHTKERMTPKPALRLLSWEPLQTMHRTPTPATYRAMSQLRVDAAGRVHFPAHSVPDSPAHAEKHLLVCTLDGAPNILPDVARAILRSDHAQQRILDELASGVRSSGCHGVIFAWHELRVESEVAYLEFVREAGRRLRPMGLTVGLHLASDTPLLKRRRALEAVATSIDHCFFDPVPSRQATSENVDLIKQPPAPLVGVEDTRLLLHSLSERIPPAKTWLILHPTAVVRKREQTLHHVSVKQAMHMAYAQGSPLVRDEGSGLVWFRTTSGEGVCSVWLEDLWSLTRKLGLLSELHLQGIALWDTQTDFPAAWNYVYGQYQVAGPTGEEPTRE